MRGMTIDQLLRPNLIIYLDAPVDVVQANIRERSKSSHPWEANSPVWENSDYLEHLYGTLLRKKYLREAAESSILHLIPNSILSSFDVEKDEQLGVALNEEIKSKVKVESSIKPMTQELDDNLLIIKDQIKMENLD